MKKLFYAFGKQKNATLSISLLLLLTGTLCMMNSCAKSSTDDEDELIGNWKRLGEFDGVGRTEAVSFTIGSKIYLGGGYDGTDRLNDFWEYNPTTASWSRIADFPGVARNSAVAFSINGKGYVGTGIDDNNVRLKDFWEYNPSNNSWTRKADFAGTARYNAIGFAISDKGYIGTGYDGGHLKDLWEYNATNNTWQQKNSLTGSKRSDAVVFVYNNKAYVASGINNGSYLNDFWVYDPTQNNWTERRKISSATDEDFDDDYGDNIRRSNASVFVMNDYAYLTCGNRSGILNSTWQYDINKDLWQQKTVFEGIGREGGIALSINDRGFIITGNNSSSRFDDFWEFFPTQEQNDNDN